MSRSTNRRSTRPENSQDEGRNIQRRELNPTIQRKTSNIRLNNPTTREYFEEEENAKK